MRERSRLIQYYSIWGIVLNLLLFGMKLAAGVASGSLSVLADAFNNLSDFLAAVISILGMRMAQKPPDQKHPFGHGRSEYIASLVISVMVLNLALEFAKRSWERIFSPQIIVIQSWTWLVLLFSLLLKLGMGLLFFKAAKQYRAPTLKGMALDSFSDLAVTGLVLLALGLSHFTTKAFDAYLGLLLAFWIAYLGFRLAKESASTLLGEAPAFVVTHSIERLLLESSVMTNPHDLRVHQYGDGKVIASIHVSVDPAATVLKAHQAIDEIEKKAQERLGIELVIHMDPRGFED